MADKLKEYTGTCYVGTVGSDIEYGVARDSIDSIYRRPGDSQIMYIRATKGYEARQLHFNNFIESKHDFLLLLDGDQIFPVDTLERLRSHKLPYVSGYFMRRRYAPIIPLWYEYGPRGKWPLTPMTIDPERGKLIKIGASGWGCVLIHRDVIEAVRKLLKGETYVLEDDMDIWPYDLKRIMGALRGLEALHKDKPTGANLYPALAEHIKVLKDEIRPLRVVKDVVGSDLRFPFFAREAGFDLWGDPDVRGGHIVPYPVQPDDYSGMAEEDRAKLTAEARKESAHEHRRITAELKAVNNG